MTSFLIFLIYIVSFILLKRFLGRFVYRSYRVGLNGKIIEVLKIKTLRDHSDKYTFAKHGEYLPLGRFLRSTHLDELPQLWNVFKRDMNLVGPRPEEDRTFKYLPEETKRILISRRPGMTSLASLHFSDEDEILAKSPQTYRDYWEKIKPMKVLLDVFYVQHRDWLLDAWLLWRTALLILRKLFR